jgi:hypothetical protein
MHELSPPIAPISARIGCGCASTGRARAADGFAHTGSGNIPATAQASAAQCARHHRRQRRLDLNVYDGDRARLIREWAPVAAIIPPPASDDSVSSHSRRAEADADQAPSAGEYPAAPSAADGNRIVETKKKLDALGYHEFGMLNADWGGRTVAAIAAYKLDRGLTGPAEIDDTLTAQLNKDIADGWRRPQKDERANATVSDLAPHNETIQQNWWTRLWSKLVAIPAGIGAVISGIMDKFPDAKANYIDPVMGFFIDVPGWLWFVIAGGAAAAIWVGTRKADTTIVKQFQDGRLLR